MLPSGEWRGFWEDMGSGRQSAQTMTLRFDERRVQGEGNDSIGPFAIDGTYTEQEEVSFLKEYAGKHALLYEGHVDHLGLLLGMWCDDVGWSDRFVLWPRHGPWKATFSGDHPGSDAIIPPGVLFAGWIAHAERGPADEHYFWAWEGLNDLVYKDPERAWPLVHNLAADSPSDKVLGNVAAGPLENLLCYHGQAVIDRVLVAARSDPRFRRCLRGVWGWSGMDKEVWRRIEQAVKAIPPW